MVDPASFPVTPHPTDSSSGLAGPARTISTFTSRVQTFDLPAVARARVAQTIVQAVGATLPELDGLGDDAIPSPERRKGHFFTLKTLTGKYGPPRNFEWGREMASSRVWEKEGDYLFYAVIPRRGNKVEYRIAIYFTAAIEALIQPEKSGLGTKPHAKTGF